MKSLLSLALLLVLSATAAAQDVRHVVVVFLDDVGRDVVGCYGFPGPAPTPTIDAMAASGIRFTHAWAMPTCSPSRAAALTGLYGSRTGVHTGVPTFDPQSTEQGDFVPSVDEPWLPRLLNSAHVRSYLVGKLHLVTTEAPDFHQFPMALGFARWRGHLSNLNSESPYAWQKQIADSAGWSEVTSHTFVTTDNVLEAWLALQASAGTRSVVVLAFNAAHAPWDELPPFGLYTPQGGIQSQAKKERYALEALDTSLGQFRSFYASQKPDDAAHTLWIVMGDNGTPAAASTALPGYSHKATVYEGGLGVPLIVCGAGVGDPGRVSDHVVSVVDIHATVLSMLGAAPVTPTDSISFAPVIASASAAPARATAYGAEASPNGFAAHDWLQHAATDGRWKLTERDGLILGPAHELFDLSVDPTELHNLWPANTPDEDAAVALLQPVLDDGDQR